VGEVDGRARGVGKPVWVRARWSFRAPASLHSSTLSPCPQRDDGIPDVFKTFRGAFAAQAKGPGHEVGDLGRLLAMYERWQARVFPHCEFPQFLDKVEKLYGKPGGRGDRGANLKVRGIGTGVRRVERRRCSEAVGSITGEG